MIVCERGDLVFVFNFHPTNSYTDYKVGCNHPGPYKVRLRGPCCAADVPCHVCSLTSPLLALNRLRRLRTQCLVVLSSSKVVLGKEHHTAMPFTWPPTPTHPHAQSSVTIITNFLTATPTVCPEQIIVHVHTLMHAYLAL